MKLTRSSEGGVLLICCRPCPRENGSRSRSHDVDKLWTNGVVGHATLFPAFYAFLGKWGRKQRVNGHVRLYGDMSSKVIGREHERWSDVSALAK